MVSQTYIKIMNLKKGRGFVFPYTNNESVPYEIINM